MGKLQLRRGDKTDLPNPLDNGEMGWADDTRQLYIGNGVANQNLFVAGAPTTADTYIYAATSTYGGDTVANGRTGLLIESGTTTHTDGSNLRNDNAAFTAALVGMTVYNSTDGTWAKITAYVSPTVITLSHAIMAAAEAYVINSSLSLIQEAFDATETPFKANFTIRCSAGTFSDSLTCIGKTAGANKTVTIQGNSGTTTFSAKIYIRQRLFLNLITFTNKVFTYYGADVDWTLCTTTAPSKLYVYSGSANRLNSETYIIGNDSQGVTNIAATVTKGYTMYVASSTFGGSTGGDGLEITSGSATSTSANNLVDTAASFDSTMVGKTIYNSTDDTWAKVNSVTNGTTLALSVDIMASGEAYVMADAISTITLAVEAIPGQYNCDTTIKVSGETFREQVTVEGKTPSGAFQLYFYGTMVFTLAGTFTSLPAHLAANGEGSWGTWADTARNFTTSSGTPNTGGYVGYLLRTTTASQTMERIIDALPSATTGRICGVWSKYSAGVSSADIPAKDAAYTIWNFGTRVTGAEAGADTTAVRDYGFNIKAKGVTIKNFLVNYTVTDAIRFSAGSVDNNVLGCMIHDVTTTGVGGGGIRLVSGSSAIRIAGNWIYSNVTSSRAIRNEGYITSIDNNRVGIVLNSSIECSNGGVILTIFACGIYNSSTSAVNSTFGGTIFLRTCCFIYATSAGNGFNANYNSIAFSSTATVIGTLAQTEIKNSSAYGCRITDLSRGVASGFTYTTNTSGTYSADAATFGYVS